VRAATFDVAIEMMSTGAVNAYATNKATPLEMAEKLPGSKVLEGRWGIERHAIGIPKGREQAMAFIRQFTNEVKSQGVSDAAIARRIARRHDVGCEAAMPRHELPRANQERRTNFSNDTSNKGGFRPRISTPSCAPKPRSGSRY
jgi:hypothetical protein